MKSKTTNKTKSSPRTSPRTARRLRPAEAAAKKTDRGTAGSRAATATDSAGRKSMASSPLTTLLQGAIRLDLANVKPADIMALTLRIRDGLTGNEYYETLVSTLALLAASYTNQAELAAHIAALEAALKTARLAQVVETANARDVLKSAAHACESYDSSDEALVSAGWDLRRARTPSQILPPPARLKLRQSAFPGVVTAAWNRVTNIRFYDYQVFVSADRSISPDWSVLPVHNSTVTQVTFEPHTVGSLLHFRVRTVSSKGPGPWSDTLTGLVL